MKQSAIFSLLICLLFINQHAGAQNMVNNASFESGAWAQANSGSADWLTASNVFGTQTPHSGTRMMGEAIGRYGGVNFREYIKAPLTSPLVVGQTYAVEIYVSLADVYGTYGADNHSFMFATSDPYYATTSIIPMTPQYENPTIITSQTTWTLISGTFVAGSAYTWVVFGNPYLESATNFQYVGGNTLNYAYYFMDDMTVQPASVLAPEFRFFQVEGIENSYAHLSWAVPENSSGKQFEVQRSLDGENFTMIKSVQATEEGLRDGFTYEDMTVPYGKDVYYRILQNDHNGEIRYSEVQSIRLENESPGTLMNIYPSVLSSWDQLQVEYLMRRESGDIRLFLTDAAGRTVRSMKHRGSAGMNTIVMPMDALQAGTYALTIELNGQREFRKVLVIN